MKPAVGLINAGAFDELVAIHLEAGYRVALAILRDPDEARDAVQDAAFKAWRSCGQLRDGRSARAWFLRIVANQCLSVRRRHWWSVVRLPEIERTVGELPAPPAPILSKRSLDYPQTSVYPSFSTSTSTFHSKRSAPCSA